MRSTRIRRTSFRAALAARADTPRRGGAHLLGWGLACVVQLAACRAPAPGTTLLFDCRVPIEPFQQRLAAEHESMDRIKMPRRRDDLLQFVSGKRYAFVLRPDGVLAAAPLPADSPRNPFSHPLLGLGEPVVTAGGITVIHTADEVIKVVVDADSATYCPTPDTAQEAVRTLTRAGIPADRIRFDNRPRACIDQPSQTAPSMAGVPGARDYGDVMVEIDRRFGLAGKAIAAQQGDLADYELFGLLRSVRDDLPQARPPETAKIDRLDPFARTIVDTDFPFLRQAVWEADWPRARDGFARMAATCNHCHAAGNVAFLVVDGRTGGTPAASRPTTVVR